MATKPAANPPHLTPASLVGAKFGPNHFQGMRAALVGYCPRPDALDAYHPQSTSEQYFIHIPPSSVERCAHNGLEFLSICHVYGGPVSSALIEELGFYGIQTVLAYGLAGGLGTRQLKMGDYYLVESALAWDGTTPHYTAEKRIVCDPALQAMILSQAGRDHMPGMQAVQAVTGDAIYREYDAELRSAREQGCDIINCDSSHLYAVSRAVGLRSVECGVISDVTQRPGEKWDSDLAKMLSGGKAGASDPLGLVGNILRYYVEELLPALATSRPLQ
jgi:uridine phosphorylase